MLYLSSLAPRRVFVLLNPSGGWHQTWWMRVRIINSVCELNTLYFRENPVNGASFSTWTFCTSSAFQFRENSRAQQKSTCGMAVNEPGRAGEEDDGSDGQAQPPPPRQFIKRLSASVALCLDWKSSCGPKGSTCSWSPLINTGAWAGGSTQKKTEVIWVANCVWLSPLLLIVVPLYQRKRRSGNLQR